MKEKMITRTVTVTKATVMGVSLSSGDSFTTTYTLTGTFKNYDDILKNIKKDYDTTVLKHAAVVNTETEDLLFGMTESEFMSHAKQLPPRKNYNEQ